VSSARLFFAASLALSCYFIYTATSGALRSHRIANEEAEAAAAVQDLRQDKEYLEAVLKYVGSDAFVEQEARRRLGYVREGEIAVVVTSPAPKLPPPASGEWWERLFPR